MTVPDSFHDRVRRLVMRIPRGRVLSYGDVGRKLGLGPRQVAAAMRDCPPGLPWHRVVGSGGVIRIPGEGGLEQRERLLSEGILVRGRRFAYDRYRWKAK